MFQQILASLAESLDSHRIPYMIIGGQAVLLYGEPRLTRDIDVTLGANIDRLSDVLELMEGVGLTPLPEDVENFVQKTMVLPASQGDTGVRVDFIFSFTPYEREAISRANMVSLAGREIAFASVEDLIILKIFAGRPRDLEDVRSILLRNPDVDKGYIRRWLEEFDQTAEGSSFTGVFDGIAAETLK
ncbi:hypothetical protein BMS3Abin14_02232 [bacterium BMS3Abin14]|nr:hypothetical protein BMS3Abin14_02232 [bacterium BMS3Abin14]